MSSREGRKTGVDSNRFDGNESTRTSVFELVAKLNFSRFLTLRYRTVMSARALPCWRVARRPKASGWNTPMSLSAMFLCRLVFTSLPWWRTFVHEYNSFNNCDLPVPLSPTMTLIVGRKLNSYLLLNGQKLETDSFSMACVLMRKLYVPMPDKWFHAYRCSFCMATIRLRAVSSITLDSLVVQFGSLGG
ncbi:hypothetical protein DSM100238_1235 [Bifidobacterium apri]|uniref:Uncharacterized protein n=1 Tax=Bifidobacterium apri TaxID=1769423 RepID=A0A6A2VXH1_9BIFI|nr:hypothetical protein DSM100238_1235 [Bifidobacterium apri]